MRLHTTTDPTAITALVEPLLAADPVRNTVFSSIIAGLAGPDADGWCAHPVDDPGVLAARSQQHTPITVTTGWREPEPLAEAIAAQSPTALGGPVAVVEMLAAALDAHGLPTASRMDERLFRLDELTEPAAVAGTARLAEAGDRVLLVDWYGAFAREVFGGDLPPGFDAEKFLERAMQRSRFWLWIDSTGRTAAMAGRHPVAFGVARVGPVYTPPDVRGRGHGSAVTAVATRDVLDDGAVAVLYTDLANPTSNKIYQQLGYYPVEDRARLAFS
ncbi:MAG: GNAT family N-acetyltransferase [Pseudonocardiales bacterium]